MENPNALQCLLPGFRFQPTDEELVQHYLMCKVFNCVIPSSAVLDNDTVFKSDPWDLPGGQNGEEMYFFTTREAKNGNVNGNKWNRATVSGFWKATGKVKQISIPKEQRFIGMRKTLVFYKGRPSKGSKTEWIMHEYRLAPAPTPPAPTLSLAHLPQPQGNSVPCRIFLRTKKNGKAMSNFLKPASRDFFAKERADLSLAPASSSTSVVTPRKPAASPPVS